MAKTQILAFWCDEATHAFAYVLTGKTAKLTGRGKTPHALPDSLFADFDSSAMAQATTHAIEQTGTSGPVTLILPMHWCFVHILAGDFRKKTDESIAFEFEPSLPVPLEEVTCAFERLGNRAVLCVAAPTRPLGELLDRLSNTGVEIDHITVDCLIHADDGSAGELQPILVRDARWIRAFQFDQEKSIIPIVMAYDNTGSLQEQLQGSLGDAQGAVGKFVGSASIYDVHEAESRLPWDGHGLKIQKLEELAEFHVQHRSPIDLRTGALSGERRATEIVKLTRQVLGLAALTCIVLTLGLFLRTRSLSESLKQLDDQKLAVYRQVFPTSALPVGAAMRLASEKVRMEGLARVETASSKSKEPVLPAPLDALRNIVEAIPRDLPIMLSEARLDEHQLVMRGETREHRDAERIVEGINQVPGIKAMAPRTNRLKAGGVEFAINAGAENAAK